MGIQREMLRLLMNRLRLLANWLALDSAPITTAESPRWKSARMSIWAAEAGFSPSKQQFFLGFRLHLLVSNKLMSNKLVSNKGAICDFVLSPANTQERRVAEHLLAVEAKWQARQSAFLAKARPVLADNGYCGDWLASLFGKNGGALWYALRRSKMRSGEARKPNQKARQHFGLGTAACALASRGSSRRSKTSSRSRKLAHDRSGA